MTGSDAFPLPRFRLGVIVWLLGMCGVVAMTTLVLPGLVKRLPELIGREAPPIPIWALAPASFVQSSVLLALAVWLGTALASRVGLHAPVLESVAASRAVMPALRPQILPGIIGGTLGGVLLILFPLLAPPSLAAAQKGLAAPLLARVLYGGATEEILMRWGFMTLLVWLMWRFIQGGVGGPRPAYMWLAIAISAVFFGAGHLPAAYLLIGGLTAEIVIWVVAVNALFGVMFGYLFWRYGLESAMLAHALAHVVGWVAALA